MLNKKLIALFVAIATISTVSADYGDCYEDEKGYTHCKDVVEPVRSTGEFAVETTKGAGETAANILSFGAYGKHKEEKREKREERKRERKERKHERSEARD